MSFQRFLAGREHCRVSNRPPRHGSARVRPGTPPRWISPFGALTQPILKHAPVLRPRMEPSCKSHVQRKKRRAELLQGDRCRVVVVGVEIGGRWSNEAMQFITELATSKAREAPPVMRFSTFLAWQRRWTRKIATPRGRAVAHSLVSSNGRHSPVQWSHARSC